MISPSFGFVSAYRNILTIIFVLTFLLALSSCGGGVVGDDENFMVVKDQTIIHLDEIVIESVRAEKNLLVVIYDENSVLPNTKSITEIGYASVSAGQHENVVVKLNKEISNNETLYAELRVDKGTIGELELIDSLVVRSVSAVSFGVMRSTGPYIEICLDADCEFVAISPQKIPSSKPLAGGANSFPILSENRIDVKKVIASEDSWLVAYRVNSETPFKLGEQKLTKGHHSDVAIGIFLGESLSQNDNITVGLYKIHEDSDGDVFNESLDEKVNSDGVHVQVSFTVE